MRLWIDTDVGDNPDDAVAKASADRPDVVLMDLVMPRVNGVEATRQIMQRAPCPILVVTASVSTNYALACRAMGAGAVDGARGAAEELGDGLR